jgi:hypothetical protein
MHIRQAAGSPAFAAKGNFVASSPFFLKNALAEAVGVHGRLIPGGVP